MMVVMSPLIVDVEEVVASTPGDILDQPSDSTRAPAATVASPESVSKGAPTPAVADPGFLKGGL